MGNGTSSEKLHPQGELLPAQVVAERLVGFEAAQARLSKRVGHDLRNGLHSVSQLVSQLLRQANLEDEDAIDSLECIEEACGTMMHVLQRLSAGGVNECKKQRGDCSLRDMLQLCRSDYEDLALVPLTLAVADSVPTCVQVDSMALERLVRLSLTSAIRGSRHGTVHVSLTELSAIETECEEKEANISILAEKFGEEMTCQDWLERSGCERLTSELGGRCTAQQLKDKWCVTLHIPVLPHRSKARQAQKQGSAGETTTTDDNPVADATAPKSGASTCITAPPLLPLAPSQCRAIVADDDGISAMVTQNLLETIGITRCESVGDGAGVLNKLDIADATQCSHVADAHLIVLLLDVNMPGLRGDDLCAQLRQNGWMGSIVAVTGEDDPDSAAKLYAAGFSAICTKPFRETDLRQLLRNVFHVNVDPFPTPRNHE